MQKVNRNGAAPPAFEPDSCISKSQKNAVIDIVRYIVIY